MQNWQQTIISQYANSPVLNALLGSFNAAEDPSANIDSWYSLVWDVATAEGYGLDVWGRIVGINRVIQISTMTYFGFSGPDGGSGDSFNTAPFYSGQGTTSNYALTDGAFRVLIYAKAYFNITNGSVSDANNILMSLFGTPASIIGSISAGVLTVASTSAPVCKGMVLSGQTFASGAPSITGQISGSPNAGGTYSLSTSTDTFPSGTTLQASGTAYVADNANMTMVYTFSFVPTPVQLGTLASGVIPRPCGVAATVSHP